MNKVSMLKSLMATAAAALLAIVAMTSCEQRELCYDHTHSAPVALEFDWSQAPDADPVTMVVWFFSVSSGESYRFELTGDGSASRSKFDSRIKVRPGTYQVLCHNGTTDNNSETGRTFGDYRIVSYGDHLLSPLNRNDNAPLPGGTEGQPVKAPASTLYAHTLDRTVTLEPAAGNDTRIRFTPVEVTTLYDITITGVENLTYDIETSGIITGLAEAWNPSMSAPGGAEVTIPFALEHCGADCLRGSFVTFGDNAPHDVTHTLRVYTSLNYYYDFDVTEAIHKAAGTHHIEINLNGISLPSNIKGGMSPGVSDWQDAEEIELPM